MIVKKIKNVFVAKDKSAPVVAVIAPTRKKACKVLDQLTHGIELSRNEKIANEFRFLRACGMPTRFAYYRAIETFGG